MNKEKIINVFKDKPNRVKIFVAIGLIGIVLIMLSENLSLPKKDTKVKNETQTVSEYKTQLEQQLENVIEKISGVGRCKVMITFDTSSENVYAYNSSNEKDEEKEKNTYEYITIDTDNGEQTVLIKQVEPKIKGVAVICDGGDNVQVQEKIIGCVTALFNISTNRVSVNKMAQ